jgi:hypothetical protein
MADVGRIRRDEFARSTERFLAALRTRAEQTEMPQRIAAETSQTHPDAAADPALRTELQATAVESLRAFLSATTQELQTPPTVPAAAIEFARTLAQRRLGTTVLLNFYRVGQAAFWREIMTAATQEISDPVLRAEVLTRVWDLLTGWLDAQLPQLSEIHDAERDRFIRGALARRMEVVTALLDDESTDPERAEQILGHELRRQQTALIIWAPEVEAVTGSSGDWKRSRSTSPPPCVRRGPC